MHCGFAARLCRELKMHRALFAAFLLAASAAAAQSPTWNLQRINAPARVTAIETIDGQVRINAGGLWYAVKLTGEQASLDFVDSSTKVKPPEGALPDGHIVSGTRDVARAWLAEPTRRYDHGILGDTIEAGALLIETRDGKRHTVRLKDDAVFEDLEPRLADLDGDGHDEIIVVKSYLKRGSSLAVISERRGKYEIVAETPPLGSAHRWLDPAGIGDFTGDGKTGIALVRQPHVIGELQLWMWRDGTLRKAAVLPDITNHIAGTRAIHMAAAADFDGDGIADIAAPSLDRSHLRLVSFSPQPREIANVPLPAKAVTNTGLVVAKSGPPVIVVGLADGSLALIRRGAQ
jgi:FG-GAP-like repeat